VSITQLERVYLYVVSVTQQALRKRHIDYTLISNLMH